MRSSCSRSSATSSVGRRRLDLEPHDIASSPPAQLALDQLQLRAAAFVVELQLRVAGEADDARLQDLLPGKELRQMRRE